MKIKTGKKAKTAELKLHKLKKTKNDIAKPKPKKAAVPVTAAITPHTFAEKKVLAVKKKNQKQQLVESVKTTKAPTVVGQKVPQKKKDLKVKKQKKVTQVVPNSEQKHASPEKAKRKRKWKKKSENARSKGSDSTNTLVSKTIITSALKACKKALDGGFDKKKNLFGEDLKYGLQIAAIKIPDVPSRNCRVQLPNPIYREGDDICLIVKDLERGRKHDYEETLTFWSDKLRELGINYITQVIPFRQLKEDYKEYEMKLKLVHRFDRFLVDARINGHVFNFLGNNFIRRCKNPTPVILEKDEKIVKSIEKALSRLTYKQTNTGRVAEIQFATHKMPLDKAVENANSLLQALKTQYPGGWQNIRTIYLKPMVDIQLTFPLYVSKIDPNSVPVPKITGPRERFEKSMNERMLETTMDKYKFQGGNLVRVAFEKRKKTNARGNTVNKGNVEAEAAEAANVQEADSDEEELQLEKASDTEQSDFGDSGDDN